MSNQTSRVLWLRDETKRFEKRTPITPTGCQRLLAEGYRVIVESSHSRIFSDSQYRQVGCEIVGPGTWRNAPREAFILGLKEILDPPATLCHRHIYFAHCFKRQEGSKDLLTRFSKGKGVLYDLEFLSHSSGQRVAAFGVWAGFAGAALGLKAWARNKAGKTRELLPALRPYKNSQALIDDVTDEISTLKVSPKVLIIGSSGRCGRGAKDFLTSLGILPHGWRSRNTRGRSPIPEILDYDVMINCALTMKTPAPFLTKELLKETKNRRLRVIADVSCDPGSPYNPLPIYSKCTTFESPITEIQKGPPLSLIAIDHLPSLLPKESSEDFSHQLTPYLSQLLNRQTKNSPWERALQAFYNALIDHGLDNKRVASEVEF